MEIVPKRLRLRIPGPYYLCPKHPGKGVERTMTEGHHFLVVKRKALEAASQSFARYYGATIPITIRLTIHRRRSRSFPDLSDAGRWVVEAFKGRLWFSKPKLMAFSVQLKLTERTEWMDLTIERTDM